MTKNFLPAVLWLIIITFLSTKGGVSMPQFKLFEMDKLAHAAAYAVLVWLLLYGWHRWRKEQVTFPVGLTAFGFASAYGALMEFVQYTWFPNRFFELDDMLANAFGAAFAWFSFTWIMNRIN